jgi:hypothetical protein
METGPRRFGQIASMTLPTCSRHGMYVQVAASNIPYPLPRLHVGISGFLLPAFDETDVDQALRPF